MTINTLTSSITGVTVFTDRAQVTRCAQITLAAGEHTLQFDKLPSRLDADSIQVSGTGGGVLHDVKCASQYHARSPHPQLAALQTELETFEDKQREVSDHLARVNKERQFIEHIIETLTHSGDEPNNYRLEPERWIKMVEFYRERLTVLDSEQRGLEIEKRQLDNESRRIQHQIADLHHTDTTDQDYYVELTVNLTTRSDMVITLRYMVHGPSWYPVYDLRVDSVAKQLAISYMAMVQQSTGEAWEDVELQLSTAQAHIGGEQPKLNPWRIAEGSPPPVAATLDSPRRMRSKQLPDEETMSQLHEPAEFLEQSYRSAAAAAPAPMGTPIASVVTNATAVVFMIPGKKTIKSDNEPHRVTVVQERFPGYFRYSTVPKLTAHAYLKAKIKNTSVYPLLPGETQIFLDNQFVAKGHLDLVVPSEEFWISLGVDASIKVEYQLVRRLQKQAGLVNKTTRYEYDYRITIVNNKTTVEDVVIWDQVPISSHEKLQVQLIEPAYRGDSDELKKNELNYLEWFYQLKPGEKRVIPFNFVVEHPVGMRVDGL
ncbi:MAG: mucoidy inhibitor MuiA family protein [Gammaproteobacteria bacterium]|nr:mucoidy inhibitor MuiA family protein [Gammaproteobacteria bacterium]